MTQAQLRGAQRTAVHHCNMHLPDPTPANFLNTRQVRTQHGVARRVVVRVVDAAVAQAQLRGAERVTVHLRHPHALADWLCVRLR